MDNGQPVKTQDVPDFFVPVENGASESIEEFDGRNENNSESLAAPMERDMRNIGNNVIDLSRMRGEQDSDIKENLTPGLGDVVDLNKSPKMEGANSPISPADVAERAITIDENKLKIKDKLDPHGVKEIDKAIKELCENPDDPDGAALFNDAMRNAAENALKISYGDKSSPWRKAA
ncbi:hypothetical protein IKF67_02645 [Candidatus Saccharibacteria bacterium]|nr:hypothetical protein [Candidatus Saccharibacteria bacterium]